jgi:HD-like signal output (HDOD) protein
MNDVTSRVEEISRRATALYSRPTVALEVVRLTNEPQVDAHALKEVIERDPALTAKILRVVNSSFFGLRCEVSDLNQALTLLGIKPLKLLVLGFSLPDELFSQMAAEQLQWYWTTTLTRAVAARLLSNELWHESGDEAFIAGLMQDIGVLALLRELGQPYAKLLSSVIEQRSDLAALERDTLGFDHVQLSAALLTRWNLPRRIVDAVAAPKQKERLARLTTADADTARILHLADLLAQLVGQHRLIVLPELLEAGGAYCDLTKGRLTVLVEKLQPQVDQLAEVLALELPAGRDYLKVLSFAHDQMSQLTEELAGSFRQHRSEDQVYTELLAEAQELTEAMQRFLHGKQIPQTEDPRDSNWKQWHAPHERTEGEKTAADAGGGDGVGIVALLRQLAAIVPRCRSRRQELSLMLIESSDPNVLAIPDERVTLQLRQAIQEIGCTYGDGEFALLSITAVQLAVVLPDCERRQAVALANEVMNHVAGLVVANEVTPALHTATLSAGVATVAAVPKNFDPWRLVESAERCLYAARSCNTNTVKSIEI